MDKSNSNQVNWDEYQAGCAKTGFTGNVAGAWRSMDADLKGTITLEQIDPATHNVLLGFKRWCIQEFGSVRGAVGTLLSWHRRIPAPHTSAH